VSDLDIRDTPSGVRVSIRVSPRCSRAQVGGVIGGRLVVRVTAPPVDQAANEAIVELLARTLKLPRSAVTVVAGLRSKQKVVELRGVTADAVRRLSISARD
jgi:uncharacterized protein